MSVQLSLHVICFISESVVLLAEATASDATAEEKLSKQRTESKPSMLSELSKEQSVEFVEMFISNSCAVFVSIYC